MTDMVRTTSVGINPTPHWHDVDQALTTLDQRSDKNKHVRSDAAHTNLHVHDNKESWHGIGSPKVKYAEGVRLIKAAIDQDFGPGAGDLVFRNIGIKHDTDGLKLKQIGALRQEVAKLQDAEQFKYENLSGATGAGNVLRPLTDVPGFYVMRTHDKPNFDFTGDKVHISVAPKDVARAWDIMLPILLEHQDTIKEFKVTNMEEQQGKLDNESARRVYDGAQISVYLHAAPGDEKGAARRFAGVMREVSQALQAAGIGRGEQPTSDLPVNDYVSFRHEVDDLRENSKASQGLNRNDLSEDDYRTLCYMSGSDPDYGRHKELMAFQPLYQALL